MLTLHGEPHTQHAHCGLSGLQSRPGPERHWLGKTFRWAARLWSPLAHTWMGEQHLGLSLIIKGTSREGNWPVLANHRMCSFCFDFHQALKDHFQHASHLIRKMSITIIIVKMLRASVFEEGKLMPVSQGTHTFLGPLGFTGEYRPRQLGSLHIPKPMAVMAPTGLLVRQPWRENSGRQNWQFAKGLRSSRENHAAETQTLLSPGTRECLGLQDPCQQSIQK